MASIEKLISFAGGPSAVQTIIDVGANDGADSLPLARLHPGIRFIAVEPTPELAERLILASQTVENYTVVACAVGATDGEGILHIRPSNVHNSLQPIIISNVTRAGIPTATYAVMDRVTVPVRTLESICRSLGIDRIDVLHVDAQGSDLEVLESAGVFLPTIRAGVVETGRRLNLYTNTKRRRDLVRFVVANGLKVALIEANDPWNYEQNVYFVRGKASRGDVPLLFLRMLESDLAPMRGRIHSALTMMRVRAALGTRLRSLIRRR